MLTEQPMGFVDRAKSALGVMTTGKLPNPLASAPKDLSRAALVSELNTWCVEERKFWKPVFDRIRQEQRFAAGKQWKDTTAVGTEPQDEKYVGDTMQQMVNRKQAALYSKNPTPEAVVKERMNYTVWDGNESTIDACKQLIAQVAPQALQASEAEQQGQQVPPPPPQMMADLQQAQQILQDYNQGMMEKQMLEKIARTGELLIKQQWDAQTPDLLASAKQATAQIIVARAAYAKVMFKRDITTSPLETANDAGFGSKVADLQARLKEIEADMPSENDPRLYEAKLMQQNIQAELAEMQQTQEVVSDEGIVIDWLSATSVIMDRRVKCLTEFIGAHRIAHEILMTVAECESKFGVNLRDSGAKFYTETGDGWKSETTDMPKPDDRDLQSNYAKQKVCVWEIQDKDDELVYIVCDGVKDFLREPEANEPKVNRFWSIVPIKFNAQVVETNDPENDCTVLSRSDIRLAMPMQINMNWAGQEKRKHREANRPAWVTLASAWAGTTGEADLRKLNSPRNSHDVFRLQSTNPDMDINRALMPLPKQPFDENLYDNAQDAQAMMLATGMQASDIGQQRPDEKATGQNIAAQARATSEASNIDDMDFAWSTIAQMMWEMLMSPEGMSQETVQKLVGRGAVWPMINREDIASSVYFKIEAGSTGRPNQQANLQKINVVMPQLIQLFGIMGKNPEPLAKMLLKEMDANIDLDEMLKAAQVMPPPQPQQEAQRPPSVSISANLKDLPPEEQNQAVEKYYGLKAASPASTLVNKIGHGNAVQAHKENAAPPQPQTATQK